MTAPSPYCSLYITRGQMELLRNIVDADSCGYVESNPKRRLLKQIEAAFAESDGREKNAE